MADAAGADEQKAKRAAALAYDYDGDEKWVDYWSNVLIPEHLASQPDVKKHFQLKHYNRYIDSGLVVEPLATASKRPPPSTSSTSASASASASPSASQRRPVNPTVYTSSQSQNGGPRTRAAPPQAPPASGAFRLDRQSIQFLSNAWVLVMSVLTLFPFVPRGLGDRAYRFALLGTALSCCHSLYCQYGLPRTWNLHGLKTWLQSIILGSDFLQLLFSVVFVAAYVPIKYAVIPVSCRALEQVAPYLKHNFSNTQLYRKFLAKPCVMVESNGLAIRRLSANSEVGLGFLLIFLMVTPQRNVVQGMVYWQLLKLKYHAPSSSTYHRETWATIGARVNPLIQRFVPFLQTPLGYIKRWFLSAR